jgi:hypothetical protein
MPLTAREGKYQVGAKKPYQKTARQGFPQKSATWHPVFAICRTTIEISGAVAYALPSLITTLTETI